MYTVTLTDDQEAAFEYVTLHPDESVYIDGPSGRGKSMLLDYIVADLRIHGHVVIVVAPTGIVAIDRKGGGYTIHSTWHITLEEDSQNMLHGRVNERSQRATYLRESDERAVDEATMAHRHVYEAIHRCEKDVHQNNKGMFNHGWILVGDYRQIPPPIASAAPSDVFNSSIKSIPLWNTFTCLHLHTPVRTKDDLMLTSYIDSLGNGTVDAVEPDINGVWSSTPYKTFVDLPTSVKVYNVQE